MYILDLIIIQSMFEGMNDMLNMQLKKVTLLQVILVTWLCLTIFSVVAKHI